MRGRTILLRDKTCAFSMRRIGPMPEHSNVSVLSLDGKSTVRLLPNSGAISDEALLSCPMR
jgi:hypothetical protein